MHVFQRQNALGIMHEMKGMIESSTCEWLQSPHFETNMDWIEKFFNGKKTPAFNLAIYKKIVEIEDQLVTNTLVSQAHKEKAARLIILMKSKILTLTPGITTPEGFEKAVMIFDKEWELRNAERRPETPPPLEDEEPELYPVMTTKQEYALEAKIEQVTSEIDGIMGVVLKKRESLLTASGLSVKEYQRAPDELLKRIHSILQPVGLVMDVTEGSLTNAVKLFNLSFGKGTRFDAWLQVQEGEHARALQECCTIISKGTRINRDEPAPDALQLLVNAETQQAHNICLVLVFLQRMATSVNFRGNKTDVKAFYSKLVEHRKKGIQLDTESVTSLQGMIKHYQKPEFSQYLHSSFELADEFETKIKQSMILANEDNKGEKGFHWHLSEDVTSCLNELDQLNRSPVIMKVITAMPDSYVKPHVLAIRQEVLDEVLAQRLASQWFETKIPEGVFSVVDSWKKMARAWLIALDPDMPFQPEAMKRNKAYWRGCLKAGLVKAAPNEFHMSPDTGQFMQTSSNLPMSVDSILRAKIGGLKLQPIMSIIDPDTPPKLKVAAYCQVIGLLNSGNLNMNVPPVNRSGLEQARAMAESLLLYISDHSELNNDPAVSEQLDDVTKIIAESRTFSWGARTLAEISKLEDSSAYPVATLYQDRNKPRRSGMPVSLSNALNSRVRQVNKNNIEMLATLWEQFNRLRTEARSDEVPSSPRTTAAGGGLSVSADGKPVELTRDDWKERIASTKQAAAAAADDKKKSTGTGSSPRNN